MKTVLIIFLGAFSFCFGNEITKEEGVLVLTEENFIQAITENKHLLVLFYAPWSEHSKRLIPEYIKAASALSKSNPPLYLAKVNGEVHKEVITKYDIDGYPMIKFFTDGMPLDYTEGKTESDIVRWLKKKTEPPTKELTIPTEVDKFTEEHDISAVFFGTNTDSFSIFEHVARDNEDIQFANCATDECLTHFSARAGQVTLFKKFDEKRVYLTESFSESSLTDFLFKHSSLKVMKYDEKARYLVFDKYVPGLFIYRDPNSNNAEKYQELANALSGKLEVRLIFKY